MKRKKASIMDKVHPDLLASPHIVSELIDVVINEEQTDSSQQEKLVVHLSECAYCRTALIVLLSAVQEYERSDSDSGMPVRSLLKHFVKIHHEIGAKEYEQMGAYAEAIASAGKDEADKRFPILAEHIRSCPNCKSTVEDTVAFIKETEEAD